MAGIEVTGLRQTIRKLEKSGVELADLKGVMTRVGSLVEHEAESLAPKLTGRLVGSIRSSKSKNKAVVRAGGARLVYVPIQNYGGYHGIQAKHFMEQALEAKRGQVLSELEQGLTEVIHRNGL